MKNTKLEIMVPAGSFESLTAALQAGANSVYFGIEQLNMRAKAANNFKITDLQEVVKKCKKARVKTYLTVNTILYDHDLKLMKQICDAAKAAGVTAIIASDIAAIQYAHSIDLEVHISTQLNVTNIEAVKFFAQFADVVVLARELTLKQIQEINRQIIEQDVRGPKGELVKIELFAHGALCVAISGKCYMSLATSNSSANRGACLQNCRRSYKVIDEETGTELQIDNKYIMSPKDLCTIGFLDQLVDAGVSVFKLEGRGRSADYVYTVTKTYREALDSILNKKYSQKKIDGWIKDLEKVFNRGFWHGGYYLGKQLGEWSGVYGSQAKVEKTYIGRAKKYFPKVKIGEFKLDTGGLKLSDEYIISGPSCGVIQGKVKSLYVDGEKSSQAIKGDLITLPLDQKIYKNDKLFKLIAKTNA
ncbi:MAG: U32 family peptidase [Candidatus Buchananbacteria bacterium]|nr:U32 family peptidase [Candidatus Buchananbacteria bacterium]